MAAVWRLGRPDLDTAQARDRSVRGDYLAVHVQKDRDVFPVHAAHAAFGADAPGAGPARAGRQGGVDEPHLIAGGARFLIGRVIGHEREVELGARIGGQPGQRREVALLALVLRRGNETKLTVRLAAAATVFSTRTCRASDSGCTTKRPGGSG